jgi:hypothetical protein
MRKLIIGKPYLLSWQPGAAGIVPQSVTATIYWSTGAASYVMARQSGATISAIDSTRTRLTTTWPSGEPHMVPSVPIQAWIGEKAYGQVAVRIIRVDATYTYLSEPLPREVDAVECSIQLLTWIANIPPTSIPTTPQRPVLLQIAYSATVSGETTIQRVEREPIAVVWSVFATGLTDGEVLRGANWARTLYQPGTNGYQDAIDTSLDALIRRIRPELPDGTWEDQVSGEQFRRAHLLLTQLTLLDDMAGRGQPRPELRSALAEEVDAELARCFQRLEMLDFNDDGLLQPGEATAIGATPISHVLNASLVDFARQPLPTVVDRPRMDDPR